MTGSDPNASSKPLSRIVAEGVAAAASVMTVAFLLVLLALPYQRADHLPTWSAFFLASLVWVWPLSLPVILALLFGAGLAVEIAVRTLWNWRRLDAVARRINGSVVVITGVSIVTVLLAVSVSLSKR